MAFHRGDQVEIMSKEEGFQGSYFHATVVTKLEMDEYIVQFKTLLEDDKPAPLRQVHTLDEIRPIPPEIPRKKFYVKQKVDAYEGDGWWVGIITGIEEAESEEEFKYTVRFQTTGEQRSFKLENLRVHQEWVNGNWIFSKRGRKKKVWNFIRSVFFDDVFYSHLFVMRLSQGTA
ncbi:unnamed protein product [Coffea canephora]|uniref:Agenet domain-containing protein n=1 Tax=Coffea canephora TaxID=49390 RepID=A0A068V5T9_COFCA|nr:unnamed protein product [Coffea canephora]